MSDDQRHALQGPATITVALHPEPPNELVAFMVIDDEEQGEQVLALGDSDDITTLISTLIRTQNMLNESEALFEERGLTTIEDKMTATEEVALRYYYNEDDD